MELNECKKCGTVGWTLDELKSGECPNCSALANDDTSDGQLTIPDVVKSVCPRCEGTGNVGKHNGRFVDCISCKGTGRTKCVWCRGGIRVINYQITNND
jgi:DnaJ-class molecular chaperone